MTAIVAVSVLPAAAQTGASAGRVEVGVGVGWLGGAAIGEQPADLRGPSGPFRLFESESDLGAAGSFEARVGVALSERFVVEGRGAISRPEFRTTVSSDAEASAPVTLVERIDQYIVDGGVVIRLLEWEVLAVQPFASAGGGYLRQLHEGQGLVEEGHLFYVGGGVTRLFLSRAQGVIRGAGVRADARLYRFSGGVHDQSRNQSGVSASLVLTF